MQRVEVDGKVVSQLCDEEGNLTPEQFEEAMRKQAKENLTSIFLQLLFWNHLVKNSSFLLINGHLWWNVCACVLSLHKNACEMPTNAFTRDHMDFLPILNLSAAPVLCRTQPLSRDATGVY